MWQVSRSREVNQTLYSLRALACVGVVLIHAPLPGLPGTLAITLSRWAVPFFFLTSGYFAFGAGRATIRRRGRKTARLCLGWFAGYCALNIGLLAWEGRFADLVGSIGDPGNWALFLMCNWATPFAGCGHLWYLFAMSYVYLVVFAILGRLDVGRLAHLVPVAVLAALVVDWVFQAANVLEGLGLTNVLWRNWLLEGLPMFLTGWWIAWRRSTALAAPRVYARGGALMCLILVALAVWAAELLVFRSGMLEVELPMSAVVIAVGLFWRAIENPGWDSLSWAGRHLADKVYLVHYGFILVLNMAVPLAPGPLRLALPLVVMGFSAATALAWDDVSRRRARLLKGGADK